MCDIRIHTHVHEMRGFRHRSPRVSITKCIFDFASYIPHIHLNLERFVFVCVIVPIFLPMSVFFERRRTLETLVLFLFVFFEFHVLFVE